MDRALEEILELEDKEQYQNALDKYRQLYAVKLNNFNVWKYYYFFLWYCNVEDFPLGIQDFVASNELDKELKRIGNEGIFKFSNNPEGLFILGYTINLFPYYFGDYEEWEKKGQEMLVRASKLAPNNIIFKMVRLGQLENWQENKDYKIACELAAPEVTSKFNEKGLLNSYFKEVLYRKE